MKPETLTALEVAVLVAHDVQGMKLREIAPDYHLWRRLGWKPSYTPEERARVAAVKPVTIYQVSHVLNRARMKASRL